MKRRILEFSPARTKWSVFNHGPATIMLWMGPDPIRILPTVVYYGEAYVGPVDCEWPNNEDAEIDIYITLKSRGNDHPVLTDSGPSGLPPESWIALDPELGRLRGAIEKLTDVLQEIRYDQLRSEKQKNS